ncbi:hypothetical protein E2P81_ATG03670 [Venturia nashicola]|nr:hypothetical protein E2P81_ATG03670 [Venturia nashicola]
MPNNLKYHCRSHSTYKHISPSSQFLLNPPQNSQEITAPTIISPKKLQFTSNSPKNPPLQALPEALSPFFQKFVKSSLSIPTLKIHHAESKTSAFTTRRQTNTDSSKSTQDELSSMAMPEQTASA